MKIHRIGQKHNLNTLIIVELYWCFMQIILTKIQQMEQKHNLV